MTRIARDQRDARSKARPETLPRVLTRRLAVPAAAAAAIVAIGPVIRPLRDLVFSIFSGRGLLILAGFVIATLGIPLIVGFLRIREHRGWRYAGLGVVALALWIQIRGIHQDLPGTIRTQVALVEQAHIVFYGGLAFLLVRAFRHLGIVQASALSLVLTTWAGVVDEFVQFLVPSRTGEIRDIGINATAAATGVLFGLCIDTPTWRGVQGLRKPLGRCLALLTLSLGSFVFCAHLGYVIDDPLVGSFRSWSSAESLRTKAADRARRWQHDAPSGQELCCLQDYFLTEASSHNHYRNERFRAGDLVAAWHADNILRSYFAPYLDKPLPPDGRLPRDEIDRDILIRAGAERASGSFRSPVLNHRIWTRPGKRPWLIATLGLTLAFWLASSFGIRNAR